MQASALEANTGKVDPYATQRGIVAAIEIITGAKLDLDSNGGYLDENKNPIDKDKENVLLKTLLSDRSRGPTGETIELTPAIKVGLIKLAELGGHTWITDGDGWKDQTAGIDVSGDPNVFPYVLLSYF